ncbi:hypothetical protein GCM10007301_12350 [Azorhizobium oxalatiphilum]|uniref:Uncharacterized protein n=1 Tax=Azorhizobium oxalatiphilum TaxID=980631 RepID=A0A917BRU1_9HYPH|nr:hypothetical protein [Azorhizobium oxalatiphilum]GGF54365.1 hypothetical protein GCM10007301_12350 [Azorhizobium oxalatiphilum]
MAGLFSACWKARRGLLGLACAGAILWLGASLAPAAGSGASSLAAGLGTFAGALLSRARAGAADATAARHVVVLEGPAGSQRITAELWSPPPGSSTGKVLLYTPGSGQPRTDNAHTAAALAGMGFTVAALDDVETAPETRAATTPLQFDFSSGAAYELTLRDADIKVAAQAARLPAALDRLTALAAGERPPDWLAGLDLGRVGAFGWSLGGSTAADASITDRRIRAVANLDGWLFGAAAQGGVRVPYLLVLSDYPFPNDADLAAEDASRRYQSRLTRRDLEEERRLIARPGSAGYRLVGGVHENLSDLALGFGFWRTWRRLDPLKGKQEVDACLAGFFRFHLDAAGAGAPPPCASPHMERLLTLGW